MVAVRWRRGVGVLMGIMAAAGARADDGEEVSSGTVTGTFGKGVTLTTPDGTSALTIRGRIQARTTLAMPGNGDPADNPEAFDPASDLLSEFTIRRLRLVLSGYAGTKDLTYNIQLAFSNQDMESDLRSPLRDAYVTWQRNTDAQLRFGQMKVPFSRQRVTSSASLQLVDRSIVVGELNLDRDVGVQVFSKDLGGADGKVGYALGIFGGDGRNRLGTNFGYLYAGKIEIRPFGEFDDYVEGDVLRREDPKLAFAVSGGYNQATNRPKSTFDTPYTVARFDYLHVAGDAIFKWHGFSLTGEWLYRSADADSFTDEVSGVTELSRAGWGTYVQAGQMITPHIEAAARYGYLRPTCSGATGSTLARCDGDTAFAETTEIGGGASYYFQHHDLKLQADYFYLPVAAAPDEENRLDDGTKQLRVQAQVYF